MVGDGKMISPELFSRKIYSSFFYFFIFFFCFASYCSIGVCFFTSTFYVQFSYCYLRPFISTFLCSHCFSVTSLKCSISFTLNSFFFFYFNVCITFQRYFSSSSCSMENDVRGFQFFFLVLFHVPLTALNSALPYP